MGFFACGLHATSPKKRPQVEWEEPRCLLCQGQRGSILVEAPDPLPDGHGLWFAVTQCQDCGLCYTSPRPSADAIGQFYPNDYRPHRKHAHRKNWRRWTHWPRRQRDRLAQLPVLGKGRLLDFGCGSGAFLARMRQRGWQVTGIDASEEVVQRVRTDLGLSAVVGTLPHPELGNGSFDLITMRHSLEHVHQPLDVLRAAHALLAPGGKIVVSVPNIDSLAYKWFGRHWLGLDLPRHLTHFTPDTLQLMLARAGFDVGPARMVRHPEWARRSAHLASRQPGARCLQRWLRGRLLASLATWYAFLVRRSDDIVVTGVKSLPVHLEPVPALSSHVPERPRSPGGRWRST